MAEWPRGQQGFMDWIFYSSGREDLRQEYEEKKVLDRKIIDWKKKILSEGIMELIGCSTKQKDLRQEHESTTHGTRSMIELVRF